MIYQLPDNRKVLAWRSGAVLKIVDQYLWYDYAAVGPRRFGISGAPLFNAAWEPIAMVHSGVPNKDSQGRILRSDGKVWDQGDSEEEIDWIAREAVLLSSIVADAKRKMGGLSPQQRDKLFSAIGQ
jgi:endonuclease G, mitochondrial